MSSAQTKQVTQLLNSEATSKYSGEYYALFSDFLNAGCFLALSSSEVVVGGFPKNLPAGLSAGLESSARLYAPDFYLQDFTMPVAITSYQIFERSAFLSMMEKIEPDGPNPNEPDRKLNWREPDRASFETQFSDIRAGMKDRGLKKAVPTIYATAEMVTETAARRRLRLKMLVSALRQPSHLYPYGFWTDREGIIGVTPEILFSRRGRDLRTVALAGTRAKSASPKTDAAQLMDDPKERHEHQLVVDDIRQVLAKISDRVESGSTRILELPTLFHLETKFSATLKGEMDFTSVTRALHPTPALGVAPRALGFEEMRRWDATRDRKRFGAPFGISLGDGREVCVVGIRNVQWSGDELFLGSGCGIVPASDLDREWAELSLKRESVKRMLSL